MSRIAVFDVDGMTCGHCTATVERAVRAVPGVTSVDVDLKKGTATVCFLAAPLGGDMSVALVEAIEDMGFGAAPSSKRAQHEGTAAATTAAATTATVKLHVSTMYCGSCERWVTDAIHTLGAMVQDVVVDLRESTVEFTASLAQDLSQDLSRGGGSGNLKVTALSLQQLAIEALCTAGYLAQLWADFVHGGDLFLQEEPLPSTPEQAALPAMPTTPPSTATISLIVTGMSCAACSGRVEAVLKQVVGVEDAAVNLLTGRTTVKLAEDGQSVGAAGEDSAPQQDHRGESDSQAHVDAAVLVRAVEAAGYTAVPVAAAAGGGGPGGIGCMDAVVELEVSGMVCAACPGRVERALKQIEGVHTARAVMAARQGGGSIKGRRGKAVQAKADTVHVSWDASVDGCGARAFLAAIHGLGYGAQLPGVSTAGGEDDGSGGGGEGNSKKKKKKKKKKPHKALSPEEAAQALETKRYFGAFVAGLVFTLPLVIIMMVLPLFPQLNAALMQDVLPLPGRNDKALVPGSLSLMSLLGVVLATPVQFGVGWGFYVRAWQALKRGGSNMDVLIALGTSVAYGYSLAAVLVVLLTPAADDESGHGGGHGHGSSGSSGSSKSGGAMSAESAMYFETSAMLITFVALGQWLQAYTRGKTSSAVRSLLELAPDTATLLVQSLEDDKEEEEEEEEKGRNTGALLPATGTAEAAAAGVAAVLPFKAPPGDHLLFGGVFPPQVENVLGLFDFDGGDGDGGEEEWAQPEETPGALQEEEEGGQSGQLFPLSPPLDQRLYKELELDARLLMRGDLLLVRGGERVPCDGVVLKDLGGAQQQGPRQGGGPTHSSFVCVDESMLTGESLPVAKATGDQVLGGTVSVGGPFWLKATGVGAHTALQGIVRLVEEAQGGKAPIQHYADAVSAVFVPSVLLVAVLASCGWALGIALNLVPKHWYEAEGGAAVFCALFGVSVLVIACPCALGLAVPTAVMVGTGVGAQHGVLIKGGAALETAHGIDVVVFDKTGTLTHGKPEVTQVEAFFEPALPSSPSSPFAAPSSAATSDLATTLGGGDDSGESKAGGGSGAARSVFFPSFPVPVTLPRQVLWAAACCEAASEHPLGRALVRAVAATTTEEAAEEASATSTAAEVPAAATSAAGGDPTSSSSGGGGGVAPLPPLLPAESFESVAGSGVRCRLRNPWAALRAIAGDTEKVNDDDPESEAGVLLEVSVGTREFMRSGDHQAPPEGKPPEVLTGEQEARARSAEEAGQTVLFVRFRLVLDDEACEEGSDDGGGDGKGVGNVNGGVVVGCVAVADTVRPEASATVRALQGMGVEVWMASGDNWRTAMAVAARLGIEHVLAEVKPKDKAQQVRKLRARSNDSSGRDNEGGDADGAFGDVEMGTLAAVPVEEAKRGRWLRTRTQRPRRVAMVGDGVNDSPAIAEADLGVAIGAGTDVAIEAAAVVLVASDLRGVVVALHLSRCVFRRIQLNMAFSLGFNALGIPIAAGALYPALRTRLPPELAALAMALSSVCVVTSSLLLRRYKPPRFPQ